MTDVCSCFLPTPLHGAPNEGTASSQLQAHGHAAQTSYDDSYASSHGATTAQREDASPETHCKGEVDGQPPRTATHVTHKQHTPGTEAVVRFAGCFPCIFRAGGSSASDEQQIVARVDAEDRPVGLWPGACDSAIPAASGHPGMRQHAAGMLRCCSASSGHGGGSASQSATCTAALALDDAALRAWQAGRLGLCFSGAGFCFPYFLGVLQVRASCMHAAAARCPAHGCMPPAAIHWHGMAWRGVVCARIRHGRTHTVTEASARCLRGHLHGRAAAWLQVLDGLGVVVRGTPLAGSSSGALAAACYSAGTPEGGGRGGGS